jgi:hypothetical protein
MEAAPDWGMIRIKRPKDRGGRAYPELAVVLDRVLVIFLDVVREVVDLDSMVRREHFEHPMSTYGDCVVLDIFHNLRQSSAKNGDRKRIPYAPSS